MFGDLFGRMSWVYKEGSCYETIDLISTIFSIYCWFRLEISIFRRSFPVSILSKIGFSLMFHFSVWFRVNIKNRLIYEKLGYSLDPTLIPVWFGLFGSILNLAI